MLNQNKVQDDISSAYFDEISQIEVKNIELDFQVCRIFSEYQMPHKKTKLKTPDSIKNKIDHKKTSESTISTKQRSKNQDDSSNLEKHSPNQPKSGNQNSLKKNISKKVLFVDNQQKAKVLQATVKRTVRKKTIFSEFQRTPETDKKLIKSPEPIKLSRKVSKAKQIPEKCKIGSQHKRFQHDAKYQDQIRKSRQSCDSNKNMSSLKKSRSESIMSVSRKRLSSKAVPTQKAEKLKEDNRKIIMWDYFGEDEQEMGKMKTNGKPIDVRSKRSSSKLNKEIVVSRQRVESKSKQIMTVKSRQRVGSKSKDRILVFSSKNRCF